MSSISDWVPNPARWHALSVRSFAFSDHMAGTVTQICSGVVRRIEAPSFSPKVYTK